jgi:hypothetical protein
MMSDAEARVGVFLEIKSENSAQLRSLKVSIMQDKAGRSDDEVEGRLFLRMQGKPQPDNRNP